MTKDLKLNLNELIEQPKEEQYVDIDLTNIVEDPQVINNAKSVVAKKRGPGRPNKNKEQQLYYTDIVSEDTEKARKKKDSFEKQLEAKYSPNANMLYQTIGQTDYVYGQIEEELTKFRERPAMGGKSRTLAISALLGSQISAVNTKINAVKELNAMRNKINDLILKKEQMMKDNGEQNTDKMVADAFNTLLNSTRYGLPAINSPLSQASINTGMTMNGNTLQNTDINPIINDNTTDNIDPYANILAINNNTHKFTNNPNPIQNRMILEHNPDIKPVVVYDQSSGHKYFEVVNVNTGERIDNVEKPAQFLLDNMRIDPIAGLAINSQANMRFPLVIIGNRAVDEL